VAYDRRVIIAFVNLHDLSGEAPSKLLTREWSLAQAWGGDTKGIHVIRDLTPEESATAINAASLINYFHQSVGWSELWHQWRVFDGRARQLTELREPGGAPVDLVQSLETDTAAMMRRITATVSRLEDNQLLQSARSGEAERHQQLLLALKWNQRLETLRKLWDRDETAWTQIVDISDEGITTQHLAFEPSLSPLLASANDIVLARPFLASYMHDLEVVFASVLLDCEEAIVTASRNLKSLTVEILDGQPMLIERFDLTANPITLNHFNLPLTAIPGVNGALRGARHRLDNVPTDEPTSAEVEDAETEGLDSAPQNEETAPDTTPVPPLPAVDILGLVRTIRQLTPELEEKWSEALEFVLTKSEADAEISRWFALLQTISSLASQREARDSTIIPSFPLSRSDFTRLDPAADGREKLVQQETAHLYAIRALTNNLRHLQAPSNLRMTMANGTGTIKTWWGSGGFFLTVLSADLVLRLLESMTPDSDADEPDEEPRRRHEQALLLAHRSLQLGLPEASIMYLSRALKLLEIGESGSDPVFDAVHAAAAALGTGERDMPLDYLLCLANLFLNPPEVAGDASL
jgi:hypothetical protein